MIYGAVNEPVLERLPRKIERLLDVGCGDGSLGRTIKSQVGCKVEGITYSADEADDASQYLDKVYVYDLNVFTSNGIGRFDCIVCSHVLEHVQRPERLLEELKHVLSPDGIMIIALPNTVYWKQRLEFLRGKFRYTSGGLMDETHVRFYDWVTAFELLIKSGYDVLRRDAVGGFPLSRYLPFINRHLDRVATKMFPNLFGIQFVFVCRRSQTH